MTLTRLFQPKRIAVVGASRSRTKLGAYVFRHLVENHTRGSVIPVNPHATTINGHRVYPTTVDVPGSVDLAVIVTPIAAVEQVIRDCGKKHIPFAAVITAGYRETGKEGQKREESLKVVAKNAHVRLVGPNCLGLINAVTRTNASFAAGMPMKGNVGMISQSGAMAVAMLDWAESIRLGVSSLISIGNKADITENDCLEYFSRDRDTKLIMLYLESIADGKRFLRTCAAVTCRKPVLVLLAGRSMTGKRAVQSHTGALTGSDATVSAAFRQSGALRMDTMEEWFDAAMCISRNGRPRSEDTLILTNAGGPGILATDAAEHTILKTPLVSDTSQERLKGRLPVAASVHNPIDVVGDANVSRYRTVFRELESSRQFGNVVVLLTPQSMTDPLAIARAVRDAQHRQPQRIWVTSFLGGKRVHHAREILHANGIAHLPSPERAIRALHWTVTSSLQRPAVITRRRTHRGPHRRLAPGMHNVLGLPAERVLRDAGIPVLRSTIARTAAQAVRTAHGKPCVLKAVANTFSHKTDKGAVIVDRRTPAEIRFAYDTLRAMIPKRTSRTEGVLVQPYEKAFFEMVIGWVQDPSFGPVVTVGLGGIFAEQYKDVASRIAPFTSTDALELLDELRIHEIFRGVRGKAAMNRKLLASTIVAVGDCASAYPEITECDMNPVMVTPPKRIAVADARFVVSMP